MKKGLLYGILVSVMAFPLCAKALDLDSSVLSFVCDKDTIAPNEQATCTFKASLGETLISGFSTDIVLSDNLTFVSFDKNSFFDAGLAGSPRPNVNNTYIVALNNGAGDNKSGNFDIGTLVVKANENATGTASISFQDTKFAVDTQNNVVDGNVTLASKSLTIGENTNNDNNNNENNNNDNNNNDNTDTDTETKDDVKKEEPVNPKTGVTISLLGIGALVVGGASYIALKNKNYFKGI